MITSILRRWSFVNAAAVAAGLIAAASIEVPPKLAAEPDLVGLLAMPMAVTAAVWLALAVVRYWALSRA